MRKFLFLALLPLLAFAEAPVDVEAEFAAYSNYIWRGTTFTENKPSLQGEIDAEEKHGFFASFFTSNAEFVDEGKGPDFKVTQEVDYIIGKRWRGRGWEVQASYNYFTFPGASSYTTDEWNVLINYRRWILELSYLDDYFGYMGVYRYVRVGHEWLYKRDLQGAIFVGYNQFERPRGSYYVSASGNDSLNGAGNPDYIDVYWVNRKTFENDMAVELAVNWTNREEYSVNAARVVETDEVRDFAILMGLIVPFTL